jgi:hypothetical protein
MTATPVARQPAAVAEPGGADMTGGVGGAALLVAARIGLWLGVQLLRRYDPGNVLHLNQNIRPEQ